MAADQFTQISNAVFRDKRLSAKAMGIFGNISTHRDGWGVSAESIASQMRDGISAVKAGLRELEQCGYLQRTRVRNDDGTLGGAVYFITDQPEALPKPVDLPVPPQSRRSAPAVENRPQAPTCDNTQNRRSEPKVDFPTVEKPTVANRTHKKTIPQNISSKNTLSSAQREIRATGAASEDEEEAFIAWINRNDHKGPQWWRAVAAKGDLPELAAQWRANIPTQRASPALPPWCTECGDGFAAAEHNPKFRTRAGEPCPACHPDRVKDPAA